MTKQEFITKFEQYGITMEMYYIFYCEKKRSSTLITNPYYNKHILFETFRKLVNEYFQNQLENNPKKAAIKSKEYSEIVKQYFKQKFKIKRL